MIRRRIGCVAGAVVLATAAACGGGGDDIEAFCALVVNPAGLPDDGDVGVNLRFALDYERSLEGVAPSAIEDEIGVLVRYVEALLEAYEAAGDDVDLATLEATVDSTGVDAASDVVSGYAEANCPVGGS